MFYNAPSLTFLSTQQVIEASLCTVHNSHQFISTVYSHFPVHYGCYPIIRSMKETIINK